MKTTKITTTVALFASIFFLSFCSKDNNNGQIDSLISKENTLRTYETENSLGFKDENHIDDGIKETNPLVGEWTLQSFRYMGITVKFAGENLKFKKNGNIIVEVHSNPSVLLKGKWEDDKEDYKYAIYFGGKDRVIKYSYIFVNDQTLVSEVIGGRGVYSSTYVRVTPNNVMY